MKKVMRTMRPKKYEKIVVSKKMCDRYSWDELITLVDEFRNYESPSMEIEAYYGDYGIEYVEFSGRRLETDQERNARLGKARRDKQAKQAKQLEIQLKIEREEREELARLQAKYADRVTGDCS